MALHSMDRFRRAGQALQLPLGLRMRRCSGSTRRAVQLELALFWDASSTGLPEGPHAARGARNAVQAALQSHGRLVEKRVYFSHCCGSKAAPLTTSMERGGFMPVRCHSGSVVGRRLSVDLLHFAWRKACAGQAAVIGLISSDEEYAYLLHKARDLGMRTVVLCPSECLGAPSPLADAADVLLDWRVTGSAPAAEEPAVAAAERPMRVHLSSSTAAATCAAAAASPAAPLVGVAAAAAAAAAASPARAVTLETYVGPLPAPAEADGVQHPPDTLQATAAAAASQAGLAQALEGKLQSWDALLPRSRRAAQVLGYDETSWSSGDTPSRSAREWGSLSVEERTAAAQLGYCRAEWDDELRALRVAAGGPAGGAASLDPGPSDDPNVELWREDIMLGLVAAPGSQDSQQDIFQALQSARAEKAMPAHYADQSDGLAELFADDISLGLVKPRGAD